MVRATTTRDRILDAALMAFGTRGYDATSLDALAVDLGVRKQTILYWFVSKEALLDAVVERAAIEVAGVLEAAVAVAGPGVDRIDAVMKSVFRYSVRRPELLGLLREVNRLGPTVAGPLASRLRPLTSRAIEAVARLIAAGGLRPADPRIMVLMMYTLVVGVATDLETQRALGIEPTVASLRALRREMFAFVQAGVAAPAAQP